MKQISITQFKKMLVPEIKSSIPFEITSDGEVIAIISQQGEAQCPNCKLKFVFKGTKTVPFFFSARHPKVNA